MSTAPQWRSSAGFVLAALGAAVGLGNIWRSSYVAGENGGGAFVLAFKSYLYSAAVFGAIGTAGPSDLLRLEVLGPLFAIALLLLLGRLATL